MGLKIVTKRKTFLSLIFDIVKERMGLLSTESIDVLLAQFFIKFFPLSHLNRNLKSGFDENIHQRYLLRLLFLKVILPLDILRSLCLFPPRGVDLDLWYCFVAPCSSGDRFKTQNILAVKEIRDCLRQNFDDLPSDYYESFEATWGDSRRKKPVNRDKNQPIGSFSPLMLFPVKQLPPEVKLQIIEKSPDKSLIPVIDHLFICPDHFGPCKNDKPELSLRSDSIFNYSFEYILEVLQKGQASFRRGRKGWRNLPSLSVLIQRNTSKPLFDDLPPVTDSTLAAVRNLFNNMASHLTDLELDPNLYLPGNSGHRFDNGYNRG